MANWWESIELTLTDEDRSWAIAAAAILEERVKAGDMADMRANTYWTSYETDMYGRLAEAGMARHLGLRDLLPSPEVIGARASDGGIDLPGLDVGVKCSPWRCIEHFHLVSGGRMIVPRTFYGTNSTYVLCTYFLKSRRLFLDGYATREMIRRAPRLKSNPGRPAVEIRYLDLLPAAQWTP